MKEVRHSQLQSFLPQLKISKKLDEQAELLSKNKMCRAKVLNQIEKFSQQIDIISADIEDIQLNMKDINIKYLKGNLQELKLLKEDPGQLLEAFVYIQTGKNSSFEGVKGFFQRQGTLDLDVSFLDFRSIEMRKIREIWAKREEIQKKIESSKQYLKFTDTLLQLNKWIVYFYNSIIKRQIKDDIEKQHAKYIEKRDDFKKEFSLTESEYKYFIQLNTQLQKYIEAIIEDNPFVKEESFAQNLTKLIKEILKNESVETDDVLIKPNDGLSTMLERRSASQKSRIQFVGENVLEDNSKNFYEDLIDDSQKSVLPGSKEAVLQKQPKSSEKFFTTERPNTTIEKSERDYRLSNQFLGLDQKSIALKYQDSLDKEVFRQVTNVKENLFKKLLGSGESSKKQYKPMIFQQNFSSQYSIDKEEVVDHQEIEVNLGKKSIFSSCHSSQTLIPCESTPNLSNSLNPQKNNVQNKQMEQIIKPNVLNQKYKSTFGISSSNNNSNNK